MSKNTLIACGCFLLVAVGIAAAAAFAFFFIFSRADLPSYSDKINQTSESGLESVSTDSYVMYFPASYQQDQFDSVSGSARYSNPEFNSLDGNNNIVVYVDENSDLASDPTEAECKEITDGAIAQIEESLSIDISSDDREYNVLSFRDVIGCQYLFKIEIDETEDFVVEGKVMMLRSLSKPHSFTIGYTSSTSADEIELLQNAFEKSMVK